MTVFVVTPAPPGSHNGNRITALRWAKRLRELHHHVRVGQQWQDETCDVLVALHARRSHQAIARHAQKAPHSPRVLALTGTDLYGDIQHDANAQASLDLATLLVLLQPHGISQLPEHVRAKARIIVQSATAPANPPKLWGPDVFSVCVLGHLRDVKDPLRAAEAVQLLPESSRVRVAHLGAAHDATWAARAEAAAHASRGRWHWFGDRPRSEALRTLGGASLLVLTSVSEGGANVVTEAIAAGVPVVSSRIDGSVGLLGEDYPGFFQVGDTAGLAALLRRCEVDEAFYETLKARCRALQDLVAPAQERERWQELLSEVAPGEASTLAPAAVW